MPIALLAVLTPVLLAGCDFSLSVSTRTYVVDTDPGPGGDIDPRVKRVSSGGRASFRILPDEGFEIDSVSGCGGSLTNAHYTTERIWSDCVVRARFRETGSTSVTLFPEASHTLLYRGPADGATELVIDDSGATHESSVAAQRQGGTCGHGSDNGDAGEDRATGAEFGQDPLFCFHGPWEQIAESVSAAGMQDRVHASFASLGLAGGRNGVDRHGEFSLQTTIGSVPAGGITRTGTLDHEWVGHPQFLLIESIPQSHPPGFDVTVRTRVLITAREAGGADRAAHGHEEGVTIVDEELDAHERFEFHPPADSPLYSLPDPVHFTLRIEHEVSVGR